MHSVHAIRPIVITTATAPLAHVLEKLLVVDFLSCKWIPVQTLGNCSALVSLVHVQFTQVIGTYPFALEKIIDSQLFPHTSARCCYL